MSRSAVAPISTAPYLADLPMNYKKSLFTFLLFVALDQLLWKFILNEPRTVTMSIVLAVFLSLFWLIPAKSKKQLEEQFIRESGFILSPGETLEIASTANKLEGPEAVGGKLFLTNRRLTFISNKNDLGRRQQELDRTDIASVHRHAEFPKAIVIETNAKATHTFTVDRHQQWVDSLGA